jgi:hypothetical protein
MPNFGSLVSLTGQRAHQWISVFQFLTYFTSETIKRLDFNEKYKKKHKLSTGNACGLAIFFKFLTSLVLQ